MELAAAVTAVVLDDNASDRHLVEGLPQDGLEVVTIAPVESQEATVALVIAAAQESEAPVAVVDYRLDEPPEILYRGGSVATGLKELYPDLPVVLLTSDEKMQKLFASRPTSGSAFDWPVSKDSLSSVDSAEGVRRELLSIARGFAFLKRSVNDANATSLDSQALLQSVLDSAGRDLNGAELWVESEIMPRTPAVYAHWLINTFLKTTGPLASTSEAAATLGITVPSLVAASASLVSVQYDGVFAGLAALWWRSDLAQLRMVADAHEKGLESYVTVGLAAEVLEAASCTWCRGPVTRACSICELGTHEPHSIPVARQHGRWGLPAIVCFRCVARGAVDQALLDPLSADITHLLFTGELSSTEG